MKSETKLFVLLVCYVAFACIGLSMFPGNVPRSHFLTGLFLGSIFGVTILASIWTVFGPGRFAIRLSCAVALTVVFPVVSSLAIRSHFLVSVAVAQLAIVVTLVAIALICKTQFGVQLHKSSAFESGTDPTVALRQFGIRHLLVVTSGVAVLLAVGRIVLPLFKDVSLEGFLIFGFLAVGTCISCIPFLLSVLSLRRNIIPTLILFVLAGMATVGEAFLFSALKMNGPELLHFIWINFFALLPILLVSTGLRLSDYRLVGRPLQGKSSSNTCGPALRSGMRQAFRRQRNEQKTGRN